MPFAVLALIAFAPAPVGTLMPARAEATASVRIVTAARVHLGPVTNRTQQHLAEASVRIEDGSRRTALLVEFQ